MGVQGLVEAVQPGLVKGWAYESDEPHLHLSIVASAGGVDVANGTASAFRKDLETAGVGDGDHCFSLDLDPPLDSDDMASIVIYAVGADGLRTRLPLRSATLFASPPAATAATMRRPDKKIVHLHIPKTAGTSLRLALKKAYGNSLRVFPHYDERNYADINVDEYDLFSGHFGFQTASRIGGDLITVFRHPVDRFISVYYFWRQLYETGVEKTKNTLLASKFSLDEFVLIRDEPFIIEEFYNRATWQIAFGSQLEHRREWRSLGKNDDDLYQTAITNLDAFSIVGIQERLDSFRKALASKFSIDIEIAKDNVTMNKAGPVEIKARTLREIQQWVSLDLELYRFVMNRFG